MQVNALNPSGAVWWPDHDTVENANLTRFMRTLGVGSFEALNQSASAEPAWFHDALIRFLDYRFQEPYTQVLDLSICMDLKPEDRFLWMSDMGWLVGPILVFGGLQVGATVVLAEGAPNYPEPVRLWRLIERHRVTYLGLAPTVARLSMSIEEEVFAQRDLASLRVIVSTGEPWTPEAWQWTFERVGQRKVPLLNYSGGTEVGGILTGTVIHPLKPCAFAGPVPGTGADVVDAEGRSVGPGVTGELVMRSPSIGLTRGL